MKNKLSSSLLFSLTILVFACTNTPNVNKNQNFSVTGSINNTGSNDSEYKFSGMLNRTDGAVVPPPVPPVTEPVYIATVFAGSKDGLGGFQDAIGTNARFSEPKGLAIDTSNNIYVADSSNNRIRKITPSGNVTTIAGNSSSSTLDANGTNARFNQPLSLDIDSTGSIYVGEKYNIRKINTSSDVTTLTVANEPNSLFVDSSNNIYFSNTGEQVIKKFTSTGQSEIVAGYINQTSAVSGFNHPFGIVEGQNSSIYVSDIYNYQIKKIDLNLPVNFSGSVIPISGLRYNKGYSDSNYFNFSNFNYLQSMSFDNNGNLLICDGDRIRKVTLTGNNSNPSTVSTLKVNVNDNSIKSNSIGHFFYNESFLLDFSSYYGLTGIVVDSFGNIFASDLANNRIIKLSLSQINSTTPKDNIQYNISTFRGGGKVPIQFSPSQTYITSKPIGITRNISNNHIYVAYRNLDSIYDITSEQSIPVSDYDFLPFARPEQILFNNDGSLTITTSAYDGLNLITVSIFSGTTTPIDTSGSRAYNGLFRSSSGDLYSSDAYNHVIYKNNTIIAGTLGISGFQDGVGTNTKFAKPKGITMDMSGNLYVADSGNHTIRKITPLGAVSTIAGSGSEGYKDAKGLSAKFKNPSGITIDVTGNIYVADTGNNRIRKINLSGDVWTIAGDGSYSYGSSQFDDGIGTNAKLNEPQGIIIDSTGSLYVTDSGSGAIRKLTPQ